MLARLALKEIRETAWIAGLALAANLFFVVVFTGVGLPEEMWGERYLYPRLPFPDGANVSFIVIAMCLAALLGLRQSLGEAVFGTYQFLLNRPASRNRLIGMKLLVGLGWCLGISALPILLYAWWAATPGTHASPFEWSMTSTVWRGWLGATVLYLGTFLAGLRPGRWVGTRLLPMVAGLGAALFGLIPLWWWSVELPTVLIVNVLLVVVILYVARTRDYS